MKRKVAVLLISVMAASLAGCGGSGNNNAGGSGSEVAVEDTQKQAVDYGTPEDVLNKIWGTYEEGDKFAIGGGDSANMTMDTPGAFDVANTEELDVTLGLPAAEAANITEAASMLHMMNANTFTGACYKLADGTDVTAFTNAVKENIMARQWMCGMPDKLLIINVNDSYVLTAFGAAGNIDTFKTKTLAAIEGSDVICEEGIVE